MTSEQASTKVIEISVGTAAMFIVSLLAIGLGIISFLSGDIQDTENRLNERIDGLETRMDARMDRLENKIDAWIEQGAK